MINNVDILIYILILIKNNCDCEISISPEKNVLQGEKVTISCRNIRSASVIFWYFNGKHIGENEKPYQKDFIEMTKRHNGYDLIIENTTLKHRGKWGCNILDKEFSVYLNVSVPWKLKTTLIQKWSPSTTNSNKLLNVSCNEVENGEKMSPYNLQNNKSIIVTCESECGFPGPNSISVQYTNSSKSGELYGVISKSESCTPNFELRKLSLTATINCDSKMLFGRNEIRCQSQDVNGKIISNKPIFLLCPAFPRSYSLTYGEKIAIFVSIVLGIIDVMIIAFLIRKNCREMHSSHRYKLNRSKESEVML